MKLADFIFSEYSLLLLDTCNSKYFLLDTYNT